MAFLCAVLGLETKLTGLETLSLKESNRIEALKNELEKLGLSLESGIGFLSFKGVIKVDSVRISTYNDHRMAMAASLLSTKIVVEIENSQVVSKSYPSYWDDLRMLTSGSSSAL